MADSNCSMSVDGAIAVAKALKSYGIYWFEETTIPDDYKGLGQVAGSTGVPIAMGENLHTIHEFEYSLLTPRWRSLSPMRPTAVASPAGCGWRRFRAATGFPSAATRCMNCMRARSRPNPILAPWKWIRFRSAGTRRDR